MRTVIAAIAALLIAGTAPAFETTPSELSAADLAQHAGVRYKTFEIELDEQASSRSYGVHLYHEGKIVARGLHHVDETSFSAALRQRFAILYQPEGNALRITVRTDGVSIRSTLEVPAEADLSHESESLEFDSKGRLVLAFGVPKDSEGRTVVTNVNSTPEGAAWALVFFLETEP